MNFGTLWDGLFGKGSADHYVGEYRKNIEFPWKSGYKEGSSNFGSIGGILGGIWRGSTDWFFQNTGPDSDKNPAWSYADGADDYLSAEQYKDKYGYYRGQKPKPSSNKVDVKPSETEPEVEQEPPPPVDIGLEDDLELSDPLAGDVQMSAYLAQRRRQIRNKRGRTDTMLTRGSYTKDTDNRMMLS